MPGPISDLCARHAGWAIDAAAYDELPEGWRALVEELFDALAPIMARAPESRLVVSQAKEKFGGLRFYIAFSGRRLPAEAEQEAVAELVRAAEERSFSVCDACGAPGRLMQRGGWYHARCAAHALAGSAPVGASEPDGR